MINVFHIVSSKTWGGAERYASDLVAHMRHDPDYYVEVVSAKNDDIIEQFQKMDIPVSILPLKGIRDFDSPVRLARMLRKGKNIVHVHTYRDAMTAVMARIISDNPSTKVVFTPHTLKKPTFNYVSKKVYRNIDHYVFVSQFAYDHFLAHAAPRIKKSLASVIPESVLNTDTSAQAPVPDLRKELQMSPEQSLIMFHSRLNRDKGIDVLLKAVTQLDRDSYKLVILGEGQPKAVQRIKSYIVENKLVKNVYLMGFQRNMHGYLWQCDFGVQPSTIPEMQGISNLEYMKQGKPIITTSNGAQPEYVRDMENGILVKPNNVEQLVEALMTLCSDRELAQRMGRQAKHDFDTRLNYDNFYHKITALYSTLLSD
ncbi:MAG: glycosyltransferase family 4 protein [Muribaculaceae bacterium]|nr:glycosyltransferase family 4 protein [Muribaculaceae bacterium]